MKLKSSYGYRLMLTIIALGCCSSAIFGQLAGNKYIPGDYATIALAVTALNASGVGAGGVTFNIAANFTETISSTISITATGTSGNPIVFQRDPSTLGANPLITAYTGGMGTPATAIQDGIIRLIGSDYVTIDSIDVRDNPANTTNPSTMEYGYGLYKANTSNGCQYVTIKNCVITLNNINNAAGATPMADGSTGIIVMNALATTATSAVLPIAGGTNSNNKFYSNTIQNCNTGIALIGYAAASPFTLADTNNDVGGSSASTGNAIINYGGAAGSIIPATAIRTLAQYGINISYNIINNNNGSGTNHPDILRGIYLNTATSASATVTYNTITLHGGGTAQHLYAIENASGSTAAGNTINISNNLVTNGNYTTATTGGFYGIRNTATAATVTMNSNTVSNNSSSATTTGFFYSVLNSGAATSVTMNSNTVSGNSTAALTTGTFVGVYNSGVVTNLTINSNTIAGNSSTSVSGLYYAIYNTAAVTTTIDINSNNIGNGTTPAFTFNAANSGGQLFLSNTAGGASAALSISNNNFQGITYAVAGTGANTYISNTAATRSQAINDNTFTNLTVNTTGSITFIANSVVVSATGTQNVNNNSIVTAFNKTAAGGTVTLFSSLATSVAGSFIYNNNNNFSNITVAGTTIIAGWVNTDAGGATKTIQNNTFSNWTGGTGAVTAMSVNITSANNTTTGNAINNITSAGSIAGISTAAGNDKIYSNIIHTLVSSGTITTTVTGINVSSGTVKNIYQNTIYDLQGNSITTGSVKGILVTGGTTVNVYQNVIYSLQANSITIGFLIGIWVSGGTTINIDKNKIYDLSSSSNAITTGVVYGLLVSGTTANANTTVRSNLIGDLRSPFASASNPIIGMGFTSTGLTSNLNVYNNSIYLNAVSSGANFGSSGIYHSSGIATTADLNLRNNIIINTSVPNGTYFTVAYRRSSPTLTNYSAASNNNLFYAGMPATNRLIFHDATNSEQFLSGYKTRVASRDAQSVTEDMITASKFLSTSGSSASFLHLDSTKATQAESGAVGIAGVTADFDGQTIQGNTGYTGTGTAPDIGADETDGIRISTFSGTYNVGAGQTFTSLTNADGLFANMNSRGLSGDVIVNITSDLTEDGTNVLYQWVEQGIGNYTLTIKPDASTNRIISGNVLAGMIRLNGAKRVIIDGSNGTASRYLTFRNSNTAGTTGTAFTFINGATNNTIKYCNIEAYTNATNGIVLFSTSTVAGGNSNNLITYCNINATVSGNTGNLCIYSAGTVGKENSANTISNNSIFNYRDRALEISATGSAGWTVSGNSFYNGDVAASINYASASTLHGIRILGGTGYLIANNFVGGNAASAGGTIATYASTLGNVSFQGILLTTTGATPASTIKGNTIANIAISSIPLVASSVAFIGIETNGSGISIGSALPGEGNMIGSSSVNGSVSVLTTTGTSTFTTLLRGIFCNSTGGAVIGNQVGGIDIKNIGAAPAASSFIGIYVSNATAPSQVNNNIVGIAGVANSIRVLSTSTAVATSLTGINIATSVTSTVLVDGNIIQNLSNLTAVNTTGSVIGITSGAATATANITISNNTVSSLLATVFSVGTGTPTSSYFVGINNTGAAGTVRINNNIIKGLSTNSTAGNFNAIRNTGAVITTIQINSNQIGYSATPAITFNAANSGSQIFINNTGGAGTAALSISNNNVQGVIYSAAGSSANTYILNSAATLSQAINGNTFTNLNITTTGGITFISNSVIVPVNGTQNVNSNSIAGTFTKAGAGTVTLFTSVASSVAGSTINNNSNNFSNITVTGAAIIAGWVNTDAGASTKTIQNNTFSNWTGATGAITAMSVSLTGTSNSITGNAINNISSAAAITGITTGAGNDNIYSNIINTLSTTGASVVTGISITGGTAKNVYKNKIYDLQASSTTGTVNGILVSGTTIVTINIYNNLIGDLRTPAENSGTDAIRGISVTATALNSTINVYYNTLYLNASSTGAAFSTTGIYHTTSTTATTATLNLRNNSITNTSTPKGAGITAAYRRSDGTLTNYASTSNNNLFYAGTPGATRFIFYGVTISDQTIAAFKTRVSTRDSLSVTENLTTKFLSTTGSSPVFLHMDDTQITLIESGAVNITGFTDDIDGQIRAGNTGYAGSSSSPDIGADEIFGIETVTPTISYTLLANTTSTANRSVTGITITDASGINTTAGTMPRIYYKRFSDANVWLDNTSSTNGWKYTEATNSSSPFTFTIDYSLLYSGASVTAGVIQYFIVAQDIATTANIAINSGTPAVAPGSVALTSAAFPMGGAINSYAIPFSGTYQVGTSEVFTSLTKADGLFASINSAGLMGNTAFTVTSDITEDGANALNQWTESGAGNYTVTIQPDAPIMRTISGNAGSGLIRLNGADRVTIDGSNSGSGIYLSFINTNTAGATGTAFTFINDATNNGIRYCDVQAYSNATNGVILFSTASAGGNSGNRIDNCTIHATVASNTGNTAIYSAGTVGNENSADTISNNTIYGYRDRGLDISATGSTTWIVSGNSFYNGDVTSAINYAASSALHGIRILGGSGYSILNNYIGGNQILAAGTNAIYSSTSGDLSYQGILLTTSSSSPVSYIKGNTIAAISVSSVPTVANSTVFTGIETNGSGINIGGISAGEGNHIGVASNNGSILISTSTTSSANTSLITGINCASTDGSIIGNQVAGLDINNIGTAPASSSFIGLYINTASAPSQVINNVIGSSGTANSIRVLSTSSATTTSLTGITVGSSVYSDMLLSGNRIENISHLSLTSSGNFTGISNGASSGVFTISSDTIQNIITSANANSGSSVYTGIFSSASSNISNNIINNIALISTGTNAQIIGIGVSGAFADTITGNVVSGITTASAKTSASVETGSPVASAVIGILNTATAAGQVISGNILHDLNSVNTSNINTVVTGIGITATVSGNIFSNRIAGFTNRATGTNPGICGITAANGSFNLYNNSVKLDNSVYANAVKIYGIVHAAGNNWNYYHNTVSIGGNSTGTALRSAAFIRPVDGSLFLRNNVFVNTRTGTGLNYAISNLVAPPGSTWSSISSDYNDLYSGNINTTGEWGNGTNQTFAQWLISSGGGINSVSKPVSFIVSVYDLQPDSSSNCALNNAGTPITIPVVINTDINNNPRSSVNPDLGAYEFNYTAFTIAAANSSPVCSGGTVDLSVDPGTAFTPVFSWSNPATTVVSTSQNPTVSAVSGVFTVTVTDFNGCFVSAGTTVSLNPRPTAAITGAIAICEGASVNLTLTLTGTGTIGGTLSDGTAFTGTAPSIIVPVSPGLTTQYYISDLNDASCSAIRIDIPDSVTIVVTHAGDWLGTASNIWSDASNWCGGVPVSTTDVSIVGGLSHYPVISTGTFAINDITIQAGGSITVSGATLQIGGEITNNGTFIASNGTIEMNGISAQTVPAATFSGNAIKSLTVNNNAGVTLGGPLSLTDVLTVSNGSLASNGYLTLKSGATATARVAPITSAAGTPISGNVVTERYVPGRRKYRLITSPVTTSTSSILIAGQEALSIWGNWQNQGNNTTPNVGNFITGGSAADGFDTQTPNASLFTYDDVNRLYVGYKSSNGKNTKYTPLKAGIAYYMFVYGDRRNTITTSSPNNTVLISTGTLLTGNQVYNTSSTIPLSGVTGRYTLLGNPFASPIDWATIPKTDLDNAYWGWDPNLSSTGGYITVTTLGAVTLQAPYSGSTGLNQYIQSGQGFFVKTSGPSPVMTIRESDKVADFNPVAFRGQSNTLPLLAINLQYASGASKVIADGVVAAFDDAFSNQVGIEDASKMVNPAEGIAVTNTGQLLSIDARKIPMNNDTLFLNVSKLTKPQYTLQIFGKDMEGSNVMPFLEDRYLNTFQPLSLNDTNRIDFNVNLSVTASFDPNRFRIVFHSSIVLPVRFISTKATLKNEDILVKWEIAEENNIREYQVEKSVNGINFSKAGIVGSNVSNTIESYEWLDANPVTGNNYYRIRAIETGGSYFLSKIVVVKVETTRPQIKVFPNPIQNKQINLYINAEEKGQYTVTLFDAGGRQIIKQVIDHPGGLISRVISLNKMLARGVYHLHVNNKNIRYNQAIMIEF